MKKNAILWAFIGCSSLMTTSVACNSKAEPIQHNNDIVAVDEPSDGIAFDYLCPQNVSLINGTNASSLIYKKPSTSSPHLLFAEQGEGSYTQWDDEERDEDLEYTDNPFTTYNIEFAVGKENGFYKIPVNDGFGYVPANKAVVVQTQPLTINDYKNEENYTIINSGKFKGLILYTSIGEGISYELGCIDNNMLIFSHTAYSSYDESLNGLKIDDEGIIFYGKNYGGKICDYTSEPLLDINKMTEVDRTKFIESMLSTESDFYHIEVKTAKGKQSLYPEAAVLKKFSEKKTKNL